MKADGYSLAMPPNPAPLIIDRLIEIGLTEAAGMGVGPLSWFSINEWQRAVRITLSPWDTRLIRRLSLSYLEEKRLAESENHPPPWRGKVIRH